MCGFFFVCFAQDDFGANIDDLLHAQILDTLTSAPEPRTLVLLTGDGNFNSGGPLCLVCVCDAFSFPGCVWLWLFFPHLLPFCRPFIFSALCDRGSEVGLES